MPTRRLLNNSMNFDTSRFSGGSAEPYFARALTPGAAIGIIGPHPAGVAPTLTYNGGTVGFVESTTGPNPLIQVAPNLTVTDPDDTMLESATVAIRHDSGFQPSEDILAFVNNDALGYGNITASYDAPSGVLTMTSAGGTATLSQWQNALRHVTYTNPSERPVASHKHIDITVNDGDSNSNAITADVFVQEVNDPPNGTNQIFTFNEDTDFNILASYFGFTDVDGDSFQSILITLPTTGGTLWIDPSGASPPHVITPNQGDHLVFMFISAFGPNDRIFFRPNSELSGDGTASIAFQVIDTRSGTDPNPNTLTFNITAVDDPPVAVGLDGDYTTYVVGSGATPIDLGANAIITDVDNTNFNGGLLQVELTDSVGAEDVLGIAGSGISLSNGTNVGSVVSVDGIAVGTISAGGAGSDTLTIDLNSAATLAAVNRLVHALNYQDSDSVTPTLGERHLTITLDDGGPNQLVADVIVNVVLTDAPAHANNDAFDLFEYQFVTGNLFADNGAGVDSDPDNPVVTIVAVNGNAAAVGNQITLANGQSLTVNADGSFTYVPNHAFDYVPPASSGATNLTAVDSFTYTLAGGNTATVTLTITGVDSDDLVLGSPGNDVLFGFGGNDIIDGGAGADAMHPGNHNANTGITMDTVVIDNPGDTIVVDNGVTLRVKVVTGIDYGLPADIGYVDLASVDPNGTAGLTLLGNQFANVITGDNGLNYINGGSGDDKLLGLGGNDTIQGGAGADFILGGDGNDALYGDADNDVILGEAGNDYIVGGGGDDAMYGGAGNDTYFFDSPGDFAVELAGEGQDIIYTTSTQILAAGNEIEIVSALDNNSTAPLDLYGNELANQLWGDNGVNYLGGGGGADVLIGYGGNDTLVGDDGNDYADGGAGADSINGGAGADFLIGGDGDDYVDGGTGNDLLIGGIGNDFLVGGTGGDGMYGGAGNDTYIFDDASDYAIENAGEGTDAIYTSVSYSLTPGSEIEILSASATNTTNAMNLFGNALANQIWGNDGANYLDGGAGNDYLAGNGGDDLLIGGTGNDTLAGGGGADSFAFTSALNAATNVDIILDFSSADDTIVLDHSVFAGLTGGPLAAGAFVIGSAALDADDRIIYNSATGAIFFDADGSGAGAAVQFATVAAGTTLTASDFYVV